MTTTPSPRHRACSRRNWKEKDMTDHLNTPAFARQGIYLDSGRIVGAQTGMMLRDYFAAKAMHQLLEGAILPVGYDASEDFKNLASRSYELADAMLEARKLCD